VVRGARAGHAVHRGAASQAHFRGKGCHRATLAGYGRKGAVAAGVFRLAGVDPKSMLSRPSALITAAEGRMPSNPKNTVSTVIPGPRVRILLPPAVNLVRTRLRGDVRMRGASPGARGIWAVPLARRSEVDKRADAWPRGIAAAITGESATSRSSSRVSANFRFLSGRSPIYRKLGLTLASASPHDRDLWVGGGSRSSAHLGGHRSGGVTGPGLQHRFEPRGGERASRVSVCRLASAAARSDELARAAAAEERTTEAL
jgi:hypothetical protein